MDQGGKQWFDSGCRVFFKGELTRFPNRVDAGCKGERRIKNEHKVCGLD